MNKSSINKITAFDYIPTDKYSSDILSDRALKLSKIEKLDNEKIDITSYICFKLNTNEKYGISYQDILEIVDNTKIAKVPTVQESIAGVINYRGSLISVVDLKNIFKIKSTVEHDKYDVIVIKNNEIIFGIMVDFIEGIYEYNQKKLEENLPTDGVIDTKYVKGLHHGNIAILNIEKIILDLQQMLSN